MHEQTAQKLLALYIRVATLKLLPRTGWLQRGVPAAESVAKHIFGVTMLALFLSSMLPNIDRAWLFAIALIHDMAEALLGDLPAPARALFGPGRKHAAECHALEQLLADLPDRAACLDLWAEYS